MIDILQQYGFSEKEAKVYIACLQLGNAPGSTIARYANEKRVTVYTVLKELLKKGYATEITRNGIKFFSVMSPDVLLKQQEEKYTLLKTKLPEFLAIADKIGNKPKVQFFEGLEGIKSMYEELLTSETEILSFLGVECTNKQLLDYLYHDFLKRRIQNNIHAKVILSDTIANKKYAGIDKKAKKESIVISNSLFTLDCGIDIYGPNKVNIILFHDKEMSGLIITSEKLYQSFKSIFDLTRIQNRHG